MPYSGVTPVSAAGPALEAARYGGWTTVPSDAAVRKLYSRALARLREILGGTARVPAARDG